MVSPLVGVAMLDTQFPRLLGDVGCPQSFDPPALIERVTGATVEQAVVTDGHNAEVIGKFRDAALRLRQQGADIIVTSCGFLSPLQAVLEDAVAVPVISSVLIDLAELREEIGEESPLGILTFDSRKLGSGHLSSMYGPYCISGLEDGDELFPVISADRLSLNRDAAKADALTAAKLLMMQSPDVKMIVLECTNLPPYQWAIEEFTGLPVYSILNAVDRRIRMLVDPPLGG
jgi:hypothetical protein